MGMVKKLSNLVIDEVSLVDTPANQHGLVVFSKSNEEQGQMAIYDQQGYEVADIDELAPGELVYDDNGDEYEVTAEAVDDGDDDDAEEYADQGELVGKALGTSFLEEISKAATEDQRNQVIAKALENMGRLANDNQVLASEVAQLRGERDAESFLEIAKGYDLPADPSDIAGVLHRISLSASPEDMAALDQLLFTTGQVAKQAYAEIGSSQAYQGNTYDQVQAAAADYVAKSGGELSLEEGVAAFFEANPGAYDEYEAETRPSSR